MGDIKAFAYGVLNWSENRLMNASIDEFVHACLGWNHNFLFEMQRQNNLNRMLCYGIAEVMTASKKIELDKYFQLFEKKIDTEQLENINLPTTLNGKK